MDELAKRFSDLASQYAPDVVDAALNAARIEAMSAMVGGVLCFAIAYACYRVGRWMLWTYSGEDADLVAMGGGVAWIVGGVTGAIGAWAFLDPWVWVALTRPELYIAKKAIGL